MKSKMLFIFTVVAILAGVHYFSNSGAKPAPEVSKPQKTQNAPALIKATIPVGFEKVGSTKQ